MNRFVIRALCLATVAAASACGEAPPSDFPMPPDAPPGPSLQRLSFTGVAEPASGRLQLVLGPQATMGRIPESADGNALTVAANTVQVYGATVSYLSNNALYPAGCNPASPQLMVASVEIFSGYTEQLRNVYANLTATSSGPTTCATNSLGGFSAAIGPSVGAWLYQPLNTVTSAQSAIKRSVQWALNLPDNSAYWFTGDVWAEVIPAPPVISAPPDTGIVHTGGTATTSVTFTWANDPAANGTNPENFVVARPSSRGARLTLLQCGAGPTYVPSTCTTTLISARTTNLSVTQAGLIAGTWYQWSLESAFRLPGSGATRYGVKTSRVFQVVNP